MKKVWIDAGHGGKDPGAVANGLKEKDIVLSVALEIKKRLEANYDGVQVLLSRSTDVFWNLRSAQVLQTKLVLTFWCPCTVMLVAALVALKPLDIQKHQPHQQHFKTSYTRRLWTRSIGLRLE